jgi:hypothetical protein
MPCITTETTMTARATRAQENSLAAFQARTAEVDTVLAALQQASEDQLGADPETVI